MPAKPIFSGKNLEWNGGKEDMGQWERVHSLDFVYLPWQVCYFSNLIKELYKALMLEKRQNTD